MTMITTLQLALYPSSTYFILLLPNLSPYSSQPFLLPFPSTLTFSPLPNQLQSVRSSSTTTFTKHLHCTPSPICRPAPPQNLCNPLLPLNLSAFPLFPSELSHPALNFPHPSFPRTPFVIPYPPLTPLPPCSCTNPHPSGHRCFLKCDVSSPINEQSQQ